MYLVAFLSFCHTLGNRSTKAVTIDIDVNHHTLGILDTVRYPVRYLSSSVEILVLSSGLSTNKLYIEGNVMSKPLFRLRYNSQYECCLSKDSFTRLISSGTHHYCKYQPFTNSRTDHHQNQESTLTQKRPTMPESPNRTHTTMYPSTSPSKYPTLQCVDL